MTSALDMTLDALIEKNKKSAAGASLGRGGGGGGRGGAGPARRFLNRAGNRPAPYSHGKAPKSAWQRSEFSDRMAAAAAPAAVGRALAIETGTKLHISNLDYGVSNEDIKELFSEVGDLKRYSIKYDRSGRSKGTAAVVFARRADALAAVKRYNNVQLDGQPMKIEIVGTNVEASTFLPFALNVPSGNLNGAPRSGPGRGVGFAGGPREGSDAGGRRRGRGGRGGGGGSRGRGNLVSAADLHADLKMYHHDAMQTN